nr:DUF2971 domain-containing protein [uncultured Brevundimonas sp.]
MTTPGSGGPRFEEPPPYLYKYRSLRGEAAAFTRDIIVKSRLWFSTVDSFNDPFDSYPHFSMESTDAEYDAYLVHLIDGNLSEAPPEVRRQLLEAMRKQPRDVIEDQMHAAGAEHLKLLAVCCMSAANDQVLMWSHYADAHAGICLRFDTRPIGENTGSLIYKVRYSRERPVINRITATRDHDAMFEATLAKADFWEYEQEYRMYRHSVLTGSGHDAFPPERLNGIIFGARCTAEDRLRVQTWIIERGFGGVEFLEAVPDRREFRLDVRPLKV